MIPKKIHFTWFSEDPYPKHIAECMSSWSSLMPEYEFVHWDMAKIANLDCIFLKEAIAAKKWAFASDYVRLWALYTEGGIYLDTDVHCYKPFNDLLDNKCFIGKETSVHIEGRKTEQYLTSHCMGAEAGHPFIKECLDYYDCRHFITSTNQGLPPTLRMSMTLLPYIQSEILKLWGYSPYPSNNQIQRLKIGGVIVYTSEFFDCTKTGPNSYCKHLALGSWRDSKTKDEKITLSYKIRWRLESLLRRFMDMCGYIITKKM